MNSTLLLCNVTNCRKKLIKQACVTSCSHIFCVDHMQSMTSNENEVKCPACTTQLGEDFGFAQINLKPTDQYKTLILSGLNPDQVLEIATRAISFFVYQLNYENKNKDNMLRHRKDQNEELRHYCTTMTSKYKADVQKLQRTIQSLRTELAEKVRDTEMQLQHIEKCQRDNKRLQAQLENFKRLLVHKETFPKREEFVNRTPTFHMANNPNRCSRFSDPSLNIKHFCFGSNGNHASPFD